MDYAAAFMKDRRWSIVANPVLKGRAVAVIGGGPSLSPALAARFCAAGPAIAVNNAYQIAPEALLVALDRRWWGWHGAAVKAFGRLAVAALRSPELHTLPATAHVFQRDTRSPYVADPGTLCGLNSGHAAVHLAMHLGATRIYLLGFDMGFDGAASHWHPDHQVPSSEANYRVRFKPDLEALVMAARGFGVGVCAVTPSRAAIPHLPPDAALKDMAS